MNVHLRQKIQAVWLLGIRLSNQNLQNCNGFEN